MSSHLLLLSILCSLVLIAESSILVYRTLPNSMFIQEFYDIPAQFGAEIPPNGLNVYSTVASDKYGCKSLNPPPKKPSKYPYAVVIQRGGGKECTFEKKVRNAQTANYTAAIIYNYNDDDDLEPMSAQNASDINIVAVFIGNSAGLSIIHSYSDPDGEYRLVINDDLPFNINTQLILPFSILIGICFLIMMFYMIYKCIRQERRLRLHRLPRNMLERIPITKFTKGQPYEVCVICLDEFVEGDKLRVLPCGHAYHSSCIDPWLTKNKRVCPICKRKVFATGETRSSRRRQSSLDSTTDTDDDLTPLLPQNNRVLSDYRATLAARIEEDLAAAASIDPGTVSSDDENVLLNNDSPSHSSSRVNPFNRQPQTLNELENLIRNERNERRSIWNLPILRLLRRSSTAISIAAPPMIARGSSVPGSRSEPNEPLNITEQILGAAVSSTQPASNNILNPNLSGSFKDDDELEAHQSIYEPIATQTPSAATSSTDLLGIVVMEDSNNSRQTQATAIQQNRNQDSIFIQTPSQGGIGVVALPNTNLRTQQNSQFPPNRQFLR